MASKAAFGAAFAALAALAPVQPCRGEIIGLNDFPVPFHWTLNTKKLVYLYSQQDTPTFLDRIIGRRVGASAPYVDFSGLSLDANSTKVRNLLKKYDGIQASLVRYRDFLMIPMDFCCTKRDVSMGTCARVDEIRFHSKTTTTTKVESQVYKHILHVPSGPAPRFASGDGKLPVTTTGLYFLVISNCGLNSLPGAFLKGSVVISHPFGFLPGIEYPKLPFYGLLLSIYAVLLMGWGCLSMWHWSELFSIQHCITCVMVLGFIEAGVWYTCLYTWNRSGDVLWGLLVVSIFFSCAKSLFSYMLVLVGSKGWGITKPRLPCGTKARIIVCSVLFLVLDTIRRIGTAYKSQQQVSMTFLMLCIAPVGALNGVIFFWVFQSLEDTMSELMSSGQDDKLNLFKRLYKVLTFALFAQVLAQAHEIFTMTVSLEDRWQLHWLYTDGISHVLFALVLVAMCVLWRPHENSHRYAYSMQIDTDEKHCDDLENDIGTVGSVNGGPVKPNVVGAAL